MNKDSYYSVNLRVKVNCSKSIIYERVILHLPYQKPTTVLLLSMCQRTYKFVVRRYRVFVYKYAFDNRTKYLMNTIKIEIVFHLSGI